MDGITLWNGDCLELMGDISDGSVDMILCDLPYGTTACGWDSVIPFDRLWGHYRRVIKPNGAIVLTASQPFTSALVMSNPQWFKYALVWEKSSATGFLDSRFRPLKAHEDILIFSPAGCSNGSKPPMAYYPQMTVGKPYHRKNRTKLTTRSAARTDVERLGTISDGQRYPRSVLYFSSETGLHPTQKPVALFEYLIRTYTNLGELVLDNTMGSGTTALAALNTGRRCIGIEKDEGYFTIAQERLADVQPFLLVA